MTATSTMTAVAADRGRLGAGPVPLAVERAARGDVGRRASPRSRGRCSRTRHGTENGAHVGDAPWVFIALVPLLVGILLSELADGALDAKAVAMLGVLVACGAALRAPSTGVTGFTGVFFLLIPGGRVFGRGFGFVQGALTMFASALLTGGVGPWLPFEMLCTAWVGFFAGCLPPAQGPRGALRCSRRTARVAGLVYGLVMDMWFWPYGTSGTQLHFVAGAAVTENLRRFWAFHLASALGFDIPRAPATRSSCSSPARPCWPRSGGPPAGPPSVRRSSSPRSAGGPGRAGRRTTAGGGPVVGLVDPHDRSQAIMGEHDDSRRALDDEGHEERLGAGPEHAEQSLDHRGPALEPDERAVPEQRRFADDVGIEHLHELGDVAARARGDEPLRQ